MVLAHCDTVQVFQPDNWTFDPFCGEIRDGKVCGLGSSDDKWGIAALLGIMRVLQDSDRKLDKKLIFASTMDEENGVGNGTLLLMLAGIKAEAALYLDGNNMFLCLGNLGGSSYYLRPRSFIDSDTYSRHADLLRNACKQMSLRRASLFDQPLLSHNVCREKSLILYDWEDENGPYFDIAFYTVPGESRAVYCRELEAVIAETLGQDRQLYEDSYLNPWFDVAIVSEDTPLVGFMSQAVREVLGREPTLTTVSKQDSFVLTNKAGIPTVAFGPQVLESARGSAHQPDECIDIEEAWDGFRIAYAAIGNWLGS